MTLQQLQSAVTLLAPLGEITIRRNNNDLGTYTIHFRGYGYTVTRTFATMADVTRYLVRGEH